MIWIQAHQSARLRRTLGITQSLRMSVWWVEDEENDWRTGFNPIAKRCRLVWEFLLKTRTIQRAFINIQARFETWQFNNFHVCYSTKGQYIPHLFIICINRPTAFMTEAVLILWCLLLKFEKWPYLVSSLPGLLTVLRVAICIFTSLKKKHLTSSYFHSGICYSKNKHSAWNPIGRNSVGCRNKVEL